jgi:hypothetical protein
MKMAAALSPETSQQICHSVRQNHEEDHHTVVAHFLLGITLQNDAMIAFSLLL